MKLDYSVINRELRAGRNTRPRFFILTKLTKNNILKLPATVWFASGSKIKDSIKYKYDSRGNICEIIKNGELAAKYYYDQLNRLVKEENNELKKTTEVEYDVNGNILRKRETKYGETTTKEYEYDGDKLVSYDGEACVYNNIGVPTTYRGKALTWQYGNQLTRFHNTFFNYDGLGRRTLKNAMDITFDSDGRIIKQSDDLEFIYDANGLAGLKYNDVTYFYRKDVQGNIIAILNTDGEVIVKYVYDAWGNHETYTLNSVNGEKRFQKINDSSYDYPYNYSVYKTVGILNPFRYRGYYYDDETGLYYLQSRYYDPEVGRFISQDSVEYADPETINGLNLYAYCGNNPIMNVDPSGNAWWHWLLGAVAVVALCAVAVGVTAVTGGTGTLAFAVAVGALKGAAIGFGAGAVAGTAIGAVAGAIYSAKTGEDYWSSVGQGALLGLGIGAFAGAIIGAVAGGISGGMKFNARHLMNAYELPTNPNVDCAEIAEDLMNLNNGKGHIINITSSNSASFNITSNGITESGMYYHNVYRYGRYIIDPRYGQVVSQGTYIKMLKAINYGMKFVFKIL